MNIHFLQHPCYIHGLCYELGAKRRSLSELRDAGLLACSIEELEKAGYRYNVGLGEEQNLMSLAGAPFSKLLTECPNPGMLIVHHSYAESTTYPQTGGKELMNHAQYFAGALARKFGIDHLPYQGSFASGCTGVLSLMMQAAALLSCSDLKSAICLTADCRPAGANYDMLREKILTSDAASGFVVSDQQRGFRLLGVAYYSSSRAIMPLVEIVKRSVQMAKELSRELGVEPDLAGALLHYPNIFQPAWQMVSQYLKAKPAQHVTEGMQERAHCLSSDSVLSIYKWQGLNPGSLHVVFNFGSGLHLGVGILKEL